MTDLEGEVRHTLTRMAGEIEMDGHRLATSAHRRVAMRRVASSVALCITIATVGLGAVIVPPRLSSNSGEQEVASPVSAGQAVAHREEELVASGNHQGFRWFYTAYEDAQGNLCTALGHANDDGPSTATGSCVPVGDDRIALSESGVAGSDMTAHGWVPARTETLVLELANGRRQDIELYPAPENIQAPIKFYVIPSMSDGAVALIAYDERGQKLTRRGVNTGVLSNSITPPTETDTDSTVTSTTTATVPSPTSEPVTSVETETPHPTPQIAPPRPWRQYPSTGEQ